MMMKLLVSVVNIDEARDVLSCGCDILDIKNPAEGSLGASHPSIIKEIVEYAKGKVEISATIGDLPYLPGTATLAALGAALLNVNYIKAGLYGVKSINEAIIMMTWITSAIREFCPKVRIITCGYGDANEYGSINVRVLPKVAYKSYADGILIDLKTKGPKNLFDYLPITMLKEIIREAHNYGLSVALAGGLNIKHVKLLKSLNVDIMGVRRGVCHNNNWLNNKISREKLIKLYELVKKY